MILKEWHKALVWEAKVLMEKKYYAYDQAMIKAWDLNYKSITKDKEVKVEKLRKMFWEEGTKQLELHTEEILRRYESKI